MKIYLAGTATFRNLVESVYIPNVLESFFYFQDWQVDYIKDKSFLLDSGAFTFMMGTEKDVDWDDYTLRYADFINRNHIKQYFELDIDCIVGYDEVKRLRKVLETNTGTQCIPVWHKSRGKEEFLQLCESYPYIAIGGIVSGEVKPSQYRLFPWFINEAHKRDCRVHGLGFTNTALLKKIHFDSVDSTSWLSGGRFGSFYSFSNGSIRSFSRPDGMRVKSCRNLNEHNLQEWIKFQKYAEVNL